MLFWYLHLYHYNNINIQLTPRFMKSWIEFIQFFVLTPIKSMAYSSQGSHTDQWDFCDWPMGLHLENLKALLNSPILAIFLPTRIFQSVILSMLDTTAQLHCYSLWSLLHFTFYLNGPFIYLKLFITHTHAHTHIFSMCFSLKVGNHVS